MTLNMIIYVNNYDVGIVFAYTHNHPTTTTTTSGVNERISLLIYC